MDKIGGVGGADWTNVVRQLRSHEFCPVRLLLLLRSLETHGPVYTDCGNCGYSSMAYMNVPHASILLTLSAIQP